MSAVLAGRSAERGDAGDGPARGGLQLIDLHRSFAGVHAVDGVSFAIPERQATGLIGPNGAGKSTLLKLVAGALTPTGGRIVHGGEDVAGLPPYRMARRGVIRTFQLSSEFARLTVAENLLVAAPGQLGDSFLGSLRGRRHWRSQQAEILDRIADLLERFGMTAKADAYAGLLSGGQKRLVEIMRALMAEPRILLLDEPLAGVNPTLRLEIEQHLMRLRNEGLTMVMVEHELASVERVCDSVIVMAQGKVLASGSMSEIRANKKVIDAYLVG
jgi:ABC-type branched-subunit amino acid transport system ATPase component